MKRSRSVAPKVERCLAGCLLGVCAVVMAGVTIGSAQQPLDPVLTANQATSKQAKAKKKPSRHKQPVADGPVPSLQIPVAPLGFAPPAVFYLTERFSQASLHFLNEDTLLFTFRVPGLIPRTAPAPGEVRSEPRQIRALVLDLPSGSIAAEAMWQVHDFGPYLWNLDNGKFLLRDRNLIEMGDASLHIEPFLRFPGQVTYIELDPENRFLIANTTELPASAKQENLPQTAAASIVSTGQSRQTAPSGQTAQSVPTAQSSQAGQTGQPGQADQQDDSDSAPRPSEQSLLRILSMDKRSVLLFSRVNGASHLPIDGEGYYEALRGNGFFWVINYQGFHGSSLPVGTVRSSCYPALEVLAPAEVLASSCNPSGGRTLSLMQRESNAASSNVAQEAEQGNGHNLWDVTMSDTRVWPQIVRAPQGRRFARSTLDVTHPIGPSAPLDREDIRSQTVDVFDTATGKVALSVEASPILDGGGNFALSPSGDRFAVLSQGAIQVFDLPAAPAMPVSPTAGKKPPEKPKEKPASKP